MGSSYWFDAINLGWSIVYIKGCQVIFFLFCLNNTFSITNSVDPDEMPHYAAFHLGLHCL